MIDFIWTALTNTFSYFFAQNAPMTIVVLLATVTSTVALRRRERRIIEPLEADKNAKRLLQLQMELTDDKVDQLHAVLYGLYRHERKLRLEQTGVPNPRAHLEMDWQTFMHSLQLWTVVDEIKNEIRRFFRDNHLAEKTDEEFHVYKDLRRGQVWTRMVKAMNVYWFSGMTAPSRSDMFDVHEKNKKVLFEIVDHIFDEGRRIAVQYKKMLDQKDKRSFNISDFM
jgi:hypothetical protein